MEYKFRKATLTDQSQIWHILEGGIARRKLEGSSQWQDGYPNPTVIKSDIEKGAGYVLTDGETVIGYSAVFINDEPEYENIKGKWLSSGDFVVFHRIAISTDYLGRGLSKKILKNIEDLALSRKIYSIKADTNFDNAAMISLFEKSGFKFCGYVYFRGSERRAYEKVLKVCKINCVRA